MSSVGGLRLRAALGGILAVALSLASAPGSTCLAGSPPAERSGLKEVEVETLVSANTAFALDLYRQLRRDGYSEQQILALGAGLARLARTEEFNRLPGGNIGLAPVWPEADEDGLLLVGSPDGFSCFCSYY